MVILKMVKIHPKNSFIGAEDIKKHKWFAMLEWNLLQKKEMQAPYKPDIK